MIPQEEERIREFILQPEIIALGEEACKVCSTLMWTEPRKDSSPYIFTIRQHNPYLQIELEEFLRYYELLLMFTVFIGKLANRLKVPSQLDTTHTYYILPHKQDDMKIKVFIDYTVTNFTITAHQIKLYLVSDKRAVDGIFELVLTNIPRDNTKDIGFIFNNSVIDISLTTDDSVYRISIPVMDFTRTNIEEQLKKVLIKEHL